MGCVVLEPRMKLDGERRAELPLVLPHCSCDENYLHRCAYHQGEHHGINFELVDEFTDLKHLLQTIHNQEERRYVYQDTQVGKVIEFLSLRHFPINHVQLDAITTLIHDRLSHIRSLHLTDTMDVAFVRKYRVVFRRFFTAVFAVDSLNKFKATVTASEDMQPLITDLRFRECALGSAFFASLGSALHYSRAVTKLHLEQVLHLSRDVSSEDLQRSWGWIVFGLFHPNSTAQINHLHLSRNMLRMEDIRTIEGVMSGGHPAHVLLVPEYAAALQRYGRTSGDRVLRDETKHTLLKHIPRRRVFALIRKSTTVRHLPASSSTTTHANKVAELLTEDERLEIFCLLDKWLCVVIPGFGLGWVARDAATEMTEIELSSRTCSPALLMRSITFHHMMECHDVEGMIMPLVTLFLQLTGVCAHLESINVSHNRIGSPDEFGIPGTEILHRLVHFSPKLTALNLSNCQLMDISPIVQAFKKGRCRIKKLNLDSNHLGFRGAFDLAMLLINNRCLSVLTLLFNDIDAIGIRALLEALQFNSHLERLSIEYGNTFPLELGDFEFSGDSKTWHENFLFERLAVLRVFESFSAGASLDAEIMYNMWELLGFQ